MRKEVKQSILKRAAGPLGLYVHIPFCASTCDFCAFYQKKPKKEGIEHFKQTLLMEWDACQLDQGIDTVFWGGGTPMLLKAQDLAFLAEGLSRIAQEKGYPLSPSEWTVEMAPAAVKQDKVEVLMERGVTRFSMGVQSFQPELLEGLGRQHNVTQIERAWGILEQVGRPNTNIDLMFALPGQTEAMLAADLRRAIELDPQHISTYCLTFEEDTALYIKLSKGQIKRDIALEARLYSLICDTLGQAGYVQYEVANFCKPGYACEHNLNTWRMHEWIGLGPSAASQWKRRRYTNAHSLDEWSRGVEAGGPVHAHFERLDDSSLMEDALIFGLRMNEGICLKTLSERFPGASLREKTLLWPELEHEGLLRVEGTQLFLTDKGRLLADAVAGEIMNASERP